MHTYLERRDHRRNISRYYHMAVRPNLFGEFTLERQWGRIGKTGQTRLEWYGSEADAEAALLAMETAKRRRGYFVEPQQLQLFAGLAQ